MAIAVANKSAPSTGTAPAVAAYPASEGIRRGGVEPAAAGAPGEHRVAEFPAGPERAGVLPVEHHEPPSVAGRQQVVRVEVPVAEQQRLARRRRGHLRGQRRDELARGGQLRRPTARPPRRRARSARPSNRRAARRCTKSPPARRPGGRAGAGCRAAGRPRRRRQAAPASPAAARHRPTRRPGRAGRPPPRRRPRQRSAPGVAAVFRRPRRPAGRPRRRASDRPPPRGTATSPPTGLSWSPAARPHPSRRARRSREYPAPGRG